MRFARAHRRWTAGIAVLALLAAAWLPLLARALAPQDAAPWLEVCSAAGPQLSLADRAPAAPEGSGQHLWDHCPCCLAHATAGGLPPALPGIAFAPPWRRVVAPAEPLAPRTLVAWRRAQPRAPPSLA